MKQIIAKLLQDFETGFMNRRQLIENLALAASAAAAMTGSAEARPPGRPQYRGDPRSRPWNWITSLIR